MSQLALQAIEAVAEPHRYGHRCIDGRWFNPNAGTRSNCAVLGHLRTAAEQVRRLQDQVHEAAHDDEAARAVAEGMTGLVMAELADEDRQGWMQSARMAIEALAAHLDPHVPV